MKRAIAAGALWLLVGCSDAAPAVVPSVADAGVAPPSFCSTRPKLEFCEDFDRHPLPAHFDDEVEEGGHWSLHHTADISLPTAVKATATEGVSRVLLRKSLSPAPVYKGFFQFQVHARPPGAEATVEVFTLSLAPQQQLHLRLNSRSEIWLAAGDVKLGQANLQNEGWTSVRFDVSRIEREAGEPVWAVTLKLGEETVLFREPVSGPALLEAPMLSVGLVSETGPGWELGFDTVTLTAEEPSLRH